jgi:hypothetical protein
MTEDGAVEFDKLHKTLQVHPEGWTNPGDNAANIMKIG